MSASQGQDLDGRLLAAALVGCYLGAVAIARLVFDFDLWRLFGVPTGDWAFVDAENVTTAAECWRRGHDALVHNPCDPFERPLNYPRLWQIVAYIGMSASWTASLALFLAASFLGSVWVLVGRLSLPQALVVTLAVCAPAVMFGVERGQTDLLVFAVMAAGVAVWRAERIPRWASPALVLVAGLLKLFPAVGLAAFALARSRRGLVAAVVAVLLFAVYVVVTLDDIRAIATILPQHRHFSYGAGILVTEVAQRFAAPAWEALGPLRQVIAPMPLAAAAVVAWAVADRSALLRSITPVLEGPPDDWRRLSFNLGALVYVGTFAEAHNWDYRLVFLLLCLPQLLAWSGATDRLRRRIGQVTTAAVLVQLWLGPYMRYRTLRDEVWSWLLALLLTVLLVPAARGAWHARHRVLASRRTTVP